MLTRQEFAAMIDHSILGPEVTRREVGQFCDDALEHGFGCVYVNQCDVAYAKSLLGDSCPVGAPIGFPQGVNTTACKIFEGRDAIANGASELDIVINVSRLKDGDPGYCLDELSRFVEAMREHKRDVVVKVIIECFYLTREQKIAACNIAADAGADFVKQATGTTPHNFHVGDIKLMNAAVGDRIGIKSSGRIVNIEDAVATIACGATRIGNSRGVQWMRDFDKCTWFSEVKRPSA